MRGKAVGTVDRRRRQQTAKATADTTKIARPPRTPPTMAPVGSLSGLEVVVGSLTRSLVGEVEDMYRGELTDDVLIAERTVELSIVSAFGLGDALELSI